MVIASELVGEDSSRTERKEEESRLEENRRRPFESFIFEAEQSATSDVPKAPADNDELNSNIDQPPYSLRQCDSLYVGFVSRSAPHLRVMYPFYWENLNEIHSHQITRACIIAPTQSASRVQVRTAAVNTQETACRFEFR